MEDNVGSVTTVKIYNQSYTIRSGDEGEYVNELARYLDERMAEVAEATSTVDTSRVAVLAALNVVDDYFRTKKDLEALEADVRERAGVLTTALREVADEVIDP